jgi:uncharacterized protein (TIRG00374 family)
VIGRLRWRDPRIWIAAAITVATLALALRDVSFRDVARDMGRASPWWLLGLGVPGQVAGVWIRARRWRHLTDALQPIPQGPLFRATAVGLMGNNVLPLRAGEVLRAWVLARESGAPLAGVFGTVVLERVIDSICFVGLAFAVIAFGVARHGGPLAAAAGPLAAMAGAPLLAVLVLRVAPEASVRLFERLAGPVLPASTTASAAGLLRRFAEGLGSLRGGAHLFWIAWHSVLLWGVSQMIPFLAGILALHLDLGGLGASLTAAYTTMIVVGIAVSIPSAPGFFGPYHLACREALSRFGVPDAEALALGTLVHAVYWVTVTGLGLAVLHRRGASLASLEAAVRAGEPAVVPGSSGAPASLGKDPSDRRR